MKKFTLVSNEFYNNEIIFKGFTFKKRLHTIHGLENWIFLIACKRNYMQLKYKYFKLSAVVSHLLSSLLLLSLTSPILANEPTSHEQNTQETGFKFEQKPLDSWYFDLNLGWIFNIKSGPAVYLNNFDIPPDRYNSPKVKQRPLVSLSAGYVWARSSQWLPFVSLGLEYSYFFPEKAEGSVEDYSEEEDENHMCKYNLTHQTLYLQGKIDVVRWQRWMPYVSAKLGSSWNKFSNFNEQRITDVDSTHENPQFPNNTTKNFSYSLGAGVDYIFTQNLWGSLGYRFDHIGYIQTDASNVFIFEHEKINTFRKMHSLIASLRYLFG